MWEDEGEPKPPKPPLWMSEQIKVRKLPPPSYQLETSSLNSPTRKQSKRASRLFKIHTQQLPSIVQHRGDGVLDIKSTLPSMNGGDSVQGGSPILERQ